MGCLHTVYSQTQTIDCLVHFVAHSGQEQSSRVQPQFTSFNDSSEFEISVTTIIGQHVTKWQIIQTMAHTAKYLVENNFSLFNKT